MAEGETVPLSAHGGLPHLDVRLHVAKVRLDLRLTDPAHLPPFVGSTLRGAFGHAFRSCVCATHRPTCGDCLVLRTCPYSYVFDTPVPQGAPMMRLYTHAPHPFVIEPPDESLSLLRPGSVLRFSLILIGKGCDYLPYFVLAFQELGKIGIGRDRARFVLQSVSDASPSGDGTVLFDEKTQRLGTPRRFVPAFGQDEDPVGRIRIVFRSPARIKFMEHLTLDLPFHVLVRALLRRISALSAFHGPGPLVGDFAGLIGLATAVSTVRSRLRWAEFQRFSGRQERRMRLGGAIGEVTYEGDLAPFRSLLRMGEWVHVGKATSFGFGRYELVRPEPAPGRDQMEVIQDGDSK